LANFDFFGQFFLKWAEKNLPLTRFKAINHRGNGPLEICPWEQYKLFVNKVLVVNEFGFMITTSSRLQQQRMVKFMLTKHRRGVDRY
jgi:hypothetical protein